ncbi:MAG: K(+)-transporting ATPase subunit F [Planctomycetaceae bacterium]|nr:K(+)-transporting ATPase subunit F [Planctomycetaceae bacterium]
MSVMDIVGLVLALMLCGYLIFAMLCPERFA